LGDNYESARHFVERMDSGDLDQTLATEIKKLSREQLERVAQILMDREKHRGNQKSGTQL
jgi:hypothetical protein